MEVDKKEVLRYLGYGRHKAESEVNYLVESCVEELKKESSMKSIYRIFPLILEEDNNIQIGTGFQLNSRNLTKNLTGCSEIVLFAATLGSKPDMLIKKYSKIDMTRAVILQSAAAAMIEAYCDEIQLKIKQELAKKKQYIRPRFSPGYGDFNICHQVDFMGMLDCPRKIGLTCTDSFMLAPSKSVTAVMGVSSQYNQCHKQGCEACQKLDCEFRRD